MTRFKYLFLILILAIVFIPFQLINSASATVQKTVEFLVGQDGTVRTSGEQIYFYFNVTIPETPTVKNAFIEVTGISYNNSGNQIINLDLEQGNNPGPGPGTDFTIPGTNKAKDFKINYDVGTIMSNITAPGTYDYTLYIKGTSLGGTGAYSIYAAKLKLTYEHSSLENEILKTVEIFIGQEPGQTPSGTAVNFDFSLTIGENSPSIKSVWVEASGLARGSGSGTIEASIVPQGNPPSYTTYNLDLSSTPTNTKFLVLHDASGTIISSDFPGTRNYTVSLRGTGFTTNLWRAKLIISYSYLVTVAGYRSTGYLISSIFDTQITDGAALNSIMWQGILPIGAHVKFQFATSNSPAGPWNFLGPDGTSLTYYEPTGPDTPLEVNLAYHNNQRYLRYKIILNPTPDAQQTPQVDDIILNWSP